jgi:hypothetical protein
MARIWLSAGVDQGIELSSLVNVLFSPENRHSELSLDDSVSSHSRLLHGDFDIVTSLGIDFLGILRRGGFIGGNLTRDDFSHASLHDLAF